MEYRENGNQSAGVERQIKRNGDDRRGRMEGGKGRFEERTVGPLYVFERRERTYETACSTVTSVMRFLISAYSSLHMILKKHPSP